MQSADTIPLHPAPPDSVEAAFAHPAAGRTARALAVEPLAVDIRHLAHLLSTSVATLWRWDSSGTLGPQGIKRGGKKLFRLAEVRDWVSQGMPDRKTWQAIQAARNGRK